MTSKAERWMRAVAIGAIGWAALCLQAGCGETPARSPLVDVTVAQNPVNLLSCFVRWTTETPTTSAVEFGEGALYTHRVSDDRWGTDHELLVFGLHAEAEVHLQAVSLDEDGVESRSGELVFSTPALPFDNPVAQLSVADADRVQPGWTLAGFTFHGPESPLPTYVAAMLDPQGEPIWTYSPPSGQAASELDVSLVDGDRVLIGAAVFPGDFPVEVDLAGAHVWEGPEQPDFLTPGYMHHAFGKLDNGNYLTLISDFVDGNLTEVVREFEPDGETAWTWNAFDHMEIPPGELSWLNAVTVDADRGVAHVNSRGQSLLMEVDRADGSVLWSLGAGGDFTAAANHEYPWFAHAHAPEIQADGNVLLHDNGPSERGYSRAVEYALDLDARTAEIVWEYPAGEPADPWYAHEFGDANRLDNGNTLITQLDEAGDVPRCHLVEVAPDGTVVWEVLLRSEASGEWAQAYTAVRIPALVEELGD
jgi:outer membrane protein assembly factor BamB